MSAPYPRRSRHATLVTLIVLAILILAASSAPLIEDAYSRFKYRRLWARAAFRIYAALLESSCGVFEELFNASLLIVDLQTPSSYRVTLQRIPVPPRLRSVSRPPEAATLIAVILANDSFIVVSYHEWWSEVKGYESWALECAGALFPHVEWRAPAKLPADLAIGVYPLLLTPRAPSHESLFTSALRYAGRQHPSTGVEGVILIFSEWPNGSSSFLLGYIVDAKEEVRWRRLGDLIMIGPARLQEPVYALAILEARPSSGWVRVYGEVPWMVESAFERFPMRVFSNPHGLEREPPRELPMIICLASPPRREASPLLIVANALLMVFPIAALACALRSRRVT